MNDSDQIRDFLRDGVPPVPASASWAQRARRAATRRRAAGMIVAAVAIAAVGISFMIRSATPQTTVASPAPTASAASSTPAEPSLVVAESQLIGKPGEAPTFCTGIVLQMLPPSCSGVEVRGDFSWESVQYKEASGVRYTDQRYRLVGRLDMSAGENGVLTVTEPVAAAPSSGRPTRVPGAVCSDPMRDADHAKAEDSDQNRLWDAIDSLPVVSVWVSDGRSEFNVVVRGDRETAFQELRKVWGGGLCVVASDKSTKAERAEALERVRELLPKGQFIQAEPDSGEDPEDPVLEVDLVKLDPPMLDELVAAAGPHIRLRVTEMFTEYVR